MDKCALINQDSGEKTWLTPKYLIDALGHFDTDPCCPDNMPWQTADRMITKEQDGRMAEWIGRVWLNPPYGKDAWPFLERMAHYNGGGCALMFVRTDTRQWQEWIFPFAHSVFFMCGRVKFCDAQGKSQGTAAIPSAIISYSQKDTEAIKRSGLKGFLTILKGEIK